MIDADKEGSPRGTSRGAARLGRQVSKLKAAFGRVRIARPPEKCETSGKQRNGKTAREGGWLRFCAQICILDPFLCGKISYKLAVASSFPNIGPWAHAKGTLFNAKFVKYACLLLFRRVRFFGGSRKLPPRVGGFRLAWVRSRPMGVILTWEFCACGDGSELQ